jgi:hypothetical protein
MKVKVKVRHQSSFISLFECVLSLKFIHVIKKKDWDSGFELHPKTVLQYALTFRQWGRFLNFLHAL